MHLNIKPVTFISTIQVRLSQHEPSKVHNYTHIYIVYIYIYIYIYIYDTSHLPAWVRF